LNRGPNPFEGNRFEGLFYPGSYEIEGVDFLNLTYSQSLSSTGEEQENAQKVIMSILEKSRHRLQGLSAARGLDPQEQITMASMVEKEAVAGEDYDKIAAVFYNRLRRNDPLGSCPTVEYVLGYHRPFLLKDDLQLVSSSPYNVYEKRGLPPTPICFFSDAALRAVVEPIEDRLIYFFVYDWTTRELSFESVSNYEEHRRNAAAAKANYAAKYGDIRRIFPDKFYED
jgi:UPF0755 protein